MPYIAPPDLRSIYGDLSTIPADFAYDQAVQSRQASALNMDVERQKLAEDTAASPFNLAAKASKMRNQALEDDLSTTLYPGRKEIAVAEQQKKQRELQAPDIHYLAQGLTQAAAATKANGGQVPVWLAPQLPKNIVDALNQPGGADQVYAAGKAIRENADKFVSQESKQDSAEAIAAEKARLKREEEAGRNARAAAANALKQRLAAEHNALVKSGSKDPTKWEALATKYAYIANDPNRSQEEREVAMQNARNAANMQAYFASLAASTRNVGTPDVGKITNLPTVPEKPMPNPTGPSGFKKDAQGRILLD